MYYMGSCRDYIGITQVLYWGYIGIMEQKRETTGIIWGLRAYIIVYMLGFYWDNGKNGNYYNGVGFSL